MSDARLRGCLTRFLPHVDERSVALTGGVAIDVHLSERGLSSGRHVVVDVDFVAAGGDTVSSSVATQFLVSHFHQPQPGYPKFLIQLVDPVSRLRVDVFPDLTGSLRRARVLEVADVQVRVLDANSILEHKLATLANASDARLVEEKHYKDAMQLGALCGRPVPSIAASLLCKAEYSQNLSARCARCETSQDIAFPLAPKREIYEVLGYV